MSAVTPVTPLAQSASSAHLAGAVEPELPLDWQIRPGVPAVPQIVAAPRHLRVVGPDETARDEGAASGPSTAFVARLAQAVTEVGYGTRPAAQLQRWVARPALAMLAARGACVQRHPSSRGPRSIDRTFRAVRGIRVCLVAEDTYETSAVLIGTQRSRAVAMRLERSGDSWIATAISLG